MNPKLRFGQIVVDCQHSARLGGFYADLLARPLQEGQNEFFAFIPPTSDPPFPGLMFLQVPEARTGKNRVHIDLVADDRDAAVARAVELGGTHQGDFDEYGTVWTTLTDPEGNLFDIAEQSAPADDAEAAGAEHQPRE
jgi:predicted enzyme related to lactoylglutathione lyase